MKKRWRGEAYKDLLWRAARATTVQHFQKAMENMKKFNEEAFNTGQNMPIIAAIDYIREYLMKRIVNVIRVIEKCDGPLTPTATRLLETVKKEASDYSVEWNGGLEYEVSGPWNDKCVVDISARVCSCRKFEVTGIPCKHLVATIWNMAANRQDVGLPENWVHLTYRLETWKQMYSFTLSPIDGITMWPNFDVPTTLLPPFHHTQIGRPRKNRRRGAHEDDDIVKGAKLSRSWKSVTCSKCHQLGHNQRSCTGQQMKKCGTSGSEKKDATVGGSKQKPDGSQKKKVANGGSQKKTSGSQKKPDGGSGTLWIA
ncbi:mutator type transposase [Tanacetum coccineum]